MDPVRVAGVILYREGTALLQHRDDRPGLPYAGWWAVFGGHVESSETPEEGARREIREELELDLTGPLRLVYHEVAGDRERFFFAAPLEVPVERLTLREGQGMALLGPDEWDNYPLVPLHRRILEQFFTEMAGL